jgi:hypothetical protein
VLTKIDDQRIAASLIVYPQPFGCKTEYNIGKGLDLIKKRTIESSLNGGYLLLNYKNRT